MAARKRGKRGGRRTRPAQPPAPVALAAETEDYDEEDIPEVPPEGPLTFAPAAREAGPTPEQAQAAPPAQYPAYYIATLYGQVAQPLAGVLFALSAMRGELLNHPLVHPELDERLGGFIEALTTTHAHVGSVLAVLQEMQQSEIE